MSEARTFEVGKTVEHKENGRRAQVVTLDKGCMQFRPMFEASAFGPAHLAEPHCLESCEQWRVVEEKSAASPTLEAAHPAFKEMEAKAVAAAKAETKASKR